MKYEDVEQKALVQNNWNLTSQQRRLKYCILCSKLTWNSTILSLIQTKRKINKIVAACNATSLEQRYNISNIYKIQKLNQKKKEKDLCGQVAEVCDNVNKTELMIESYKNDENALFEVQDLHHEYARKFKELDRQMQMHCTTYKMLIRDHILRRTCIKSTPMKYVHIWTW